MRHSITGLVCIFLKLGAITLPPISLHADTLAQALAEQRYPAALHLAEAGLRTRPADVRLLTARALALGVMGRTQDSLNSFEEALRITPEFVPALKGLVQTAYAARDSRVTLALKKLIDLYPADPTAHSMAGVLAFEAGDCSAATRHFGLGAKEVEQNPEASTMYGKCLGSLHREKDALAIFERLIRSDPKSTTILRLLASAQAATGSPELAAMTLNRALELKPEEEQTYVDWAALCILNNSAERALSIIQAGLEKLPNSARLFSLRGVVEAEKGLEEEAEKDFGIANRIDPSGQYGSAGLAVLYSDSGRSNEASEILRSRIQRNPNDATLNYLLSQALLHEGAMPGSLEFQEAEGALVVATRSRPSYVAAHTALGKLYSRKNDDVRAIAEFQLALNFDSSDRAALSQLAALLRRTGRHEEALAVTAKLRQVVIHDGQTPAPR